MTSSVIYWLNSSYEIIGVNAEWDRFALCNGGDSILGHLVIGKPLFSFIIGDSTRMVVDNLLQRAQIPHQEVCRSYRCDSPDLRRYMEMRIIPEPSKTLRLEHKLIRQESVTPPIYYQYNPTSHRPYRRCSICNKVMYRQVWSEGSDLIHSFPQPAAHSIDVVYHVCPHCFYQLA